MITTYDPLETWTDLDAGEAWRPRRRLIRDDSDLENRLQALQSASPDTATSSPGTSVAPGTPLQVFSVSATESPVKRHDRTFSLVSVSFNRDGSDPAFAGVKIWFTGYNGNPNATLMVDGIDSPVAFTCETTGENVTVIVQAMGASGTVSDFDTAPTTTVLLDGVISAPPAPTLTQSLLPIPAGLQFSFAQLSGLAADVVAAYRVYRNTINDAPSATLLRTFVHDPTNSGNITFQDRMGANQIRFYWVTAVNTVGLESSKTAAQSGTVFSGPIASTDQYPVNVSYRPLSNPLTATDAGASDTISIAAFTMRIGGGTDLSISSGSITSLSYSTLYYIYYDDSTFIGGGVAFNATTIKEIALNAIGRFFVGSIKTPPAAGTATVGNNDGGSGAQFGQLFVVSPTFQLDPGPGAIHPIPKEIADGDTSTSHLYGCPANSTTLYTGYVAGFAQFNYNWKSLNLKIKSSAATGFFSGGGAGPSTCYLRYSLDAGTTWTTLFSFTTHDQSRAVTVDTIALSTNQNLALIFVDPAVDCSSAGWAASINLYEVWVEGQM
jgi:hypothetical protein